MSSKASNNDTSANLRYALLASAALVSSAIAATFVGATGLHGRATIGSPATDTAKEVRVDALDLALLRAAAINWDPTESGGPTVDPACPFGSSRPMDDLRRLASAANTSLEGDGRDRIVRMQQTLSIFFQTTEVAVGRHSVADRLFGCSSPLDSLARLDSMAIGDSPSFKRADPREERITLTITEEHLSLLKNLVLQSTDWEDELNDSRLLATPGVDPKRPYGMATDVVSDVARILSVPKPEEKAAFLRELLRLSALHEDMRAVVIVALADGTFRPGVFGRGKNGMWERKGD